jgi:hypothetical protein
VLNKKYYESVTMGLQWYEIQEQTEVTYGDRNQSIKCLECGWDCVEWWKWSMHKLWVVTPQILLSKFNYILKIAVIDVCIILILKMLQDEKK